MVRNSRITETKDLLFFGIISENLNHQFSTMSSTSYNQGDLQTKLKMPHVRRYPQVQWQYHPRVNGGVGAKHSRSVEPENAPTDGEVPFGSFWKIQFSGSMLLFRGVLA